MVLSKENLEIGGENKKKRKERQFVVSVDLNLMVAVVKVNYLLCGERARKR